MKKVALHCHPKMEEDLHVPEDHVIIDRDVFETLVLEIAKLNLNNPPDISCFDRINK